MEIDVVLGKWAQRSGPLYRRLADAVRDAIELGDLADGTVLPPQRALAARLAVGRSTVVEAYRILLGEGLLISRQGSGVRVQSPWRLENRGGEAPRSISVTVRPASADTIDLSTVGLPACSALREALEGVATDPELHLNSLGYFRSGLPLLRDTVAKQLSEAGLPTEPAQILITTSAQQAYFLLIEHLIAVGNVAMVEDPTQPRMLEVLDARGVNLRSVPTLASAGAEAMLALIDRVSPRLVYIMALGPDAQIAASSDRAKLAHALARTDCFVIDDVTHADLAFEAIPSPLPTYDDAPNVLIVGSVTKLYWGGLGIGWIRATEHLVEHLSYTKAQSDLSTPLLSQLVAARLLQRETEVREERIRFLRECLAFAVETLRELLPEFAWEQPQGGLSLWLRVPRGTASALTEAAHRHGVAIVPGSALSHHGASDNRIRIVYARPPQLFREGIVRLSNAWREVSQQYNGRTRLDEVMSVLG